VKPFTWSRQVILVKDTDPKGTSYLLVHDDLTSNRDLEPAFNLWSLTKGVEPKGDQPFHTFSGQWGVDLDVFVAEPAAPRIGFGELAHQNASVNAARFVGQIEQDARPPCHGTPRGGRTRLGSPLADPDLLVIETGCCVTARRQNENRQHDD
jgi:hypothetical protein